MRMLFSVFVIIVVLQSKAQSALSNEVFGRGIELFHEGKYLDAVKVFKECQAIDEEEMDSLDWLKDYTKSWIAHCYYKMDRIEDADAQNICDYDYEPVDRRLLVKSDSVTKVSVIAFQKGNYRYAIEKLSEARAIGARMLGEQHCFIANTEWNIARLYSYMADYDNARKHIEISESIFKASGMLKSSSYADVLLLKARININENNFKEAIPIVQQALSICGQSKNAPRTQYVTAYSYLSMASSLISLDESSKQYTNQLYESIMNLSEEEFDSCLEEVESCIGDLFAFAEYERILTLTERVIRITEKNTVLDGNNNFYMQMLYYKANALQGLMRYDEAIENIKKVISTYEYTLFCDKNQLDEYYLCLSNLYKVTSNNEKMLETAQEAYNRACRRTDSNERGLIMADALTNIAYAYKLIERNDDARKAIEMAKLIYSEVNGKESFDYWIAMREVIMLNASIKPQEAIKDLKYCIDVFKSQHIQYYELLVNAYGDLFSMYRYINQNDSANVVLDEIRKMSEDVAIAESSRDYILSCYCRLQAGITNSTREQVRLLNESISILEKYQGYDLSENKRELVVAYLNNFENEKALKVAAELVETTRNKKDLYVENLIILSLVYASSGDYNKSKSLNEEALRLTAEIYGRDSEHYILSILMYIEMSINYGLLYETSELCKYIEKPISRKYAVDSSVMGRYNKYRSKCEWQNGNMVDAIKYGEKALEIFKRYNDEREQMLVLTSLGWSYMSLGNYEKSMTSLKEALAISDKLSNNNRFNVNTINIFDALGELNCNMGNLKEASTYFDSNCEIAKQLYKDDDNAMLYVVYRKAWFDSMADISNVSELIENVINKVSAQTGQNNSLYYNICVLKAQNDLKAGNKEDAINILEKIHKFQKDNKEINLQTLQSLIVIYSDLGKFNEARSISEELIECAKEVKGSTGTIFNIYGGLVYMYVKMQDEKNAVVYLNKMYGVIRDIVLNNFQLMTKQERTNLWQSVAGFYQQTLPMMCENSVNHEMYTEMLYDATLLSKGLLLQSDNNVADIIASSDNKELTEHYNKMLLMSEEYKRLSSLYNEQKQIAKIEDRIPLINKIDSLKKELEGIEHELMGKLQMTAGDYTSKLVTRWTDVRKSLRKGQIAVEFEVVGLTDGKAKFFALVVSPESKKPMYISLALSDELMKHLPFQTADKEDMNALTNLIWKPIIEAFPGAKEIYFSLIGGLHGIPVESLPSLKGGIEIMSDEYMLYRLSSTRELVGDSRPYKSKKMAVCGGLKYSSTVDALVNDAKKYNLDIKRDGSSVTFLDERGQKKELKPLPGTEKEAKSIISLVDEEFKSVALTSYLGENGTEASFKALSGKNINIIHIGTHGFYYPQQAVNSNEHLKGILNIAYDNNVGHNPIETDEDIALTRCGLYMTGAQARLNGEKIDNVNDGILTAKEISGLDLNNVDLAVLSACDTGTGDITGDGVFGLQRGFKKAGAKAIVMSLWSVNDESTSVLMTEFYKTWFMTGNKRYALDAAKKKVRSKWSSPYYWAPFVLLDANN